jgi:hypothetical protein
MMKPDRKLKLRLVHHSKIDRDKWDRCLKKAPNAKVYAASWYLDITCGRWDALIWGDYEFVMPLPVRRKLGFTYVYTPYFSQSLGIFPVAPPEIQSCFAADLEEGFSNIRYAADLSILKSAFSRFQYRERPNRILALNADYSDICRNFSENTVRNIRKAINAGVKVRAESSAERFAEHYVKHNPYKLNMPGQKIFLALLRQSLAKGSGTVFIAESPQGDLLAGAFFLLYSDRSYYLGAFSSREGLKQSAAFAIVDAFCRHHAESGITLDFEGSELEGVDRFYKGFGAVREHYCILEYNRLPSILFRIKELLTRR